MQAGEAWRSPCGVVKIIDMVDIVPNWKTGVKIYKMTDGTVYTRKEMKNWKEINNAANQ